MTISRVHFSFATTGQHDAKRRATLSHARRANIARMTQVIQSVIVL